MGLIPVSTICSWVFNSEFAYTVHELGNTAWWATDWKLIETYKTDKDLSAAGFKVLFQSVAHHYLLP